MFSFFKRPEPASGKRRVHHYLFAFKALSQIFYDNPMQMLAILASPEGDDFLKSLWETTGRHAKEAKPADGGGYVEPKGLRCVQRGRAGDWAVAVVEMPKPVAPPEAWFVGLACRIPKTPPPNTEEGMKQLQEAEARYYTLELALDVLKGGHKNFLCAWFKDGGRANYGECPATDAESFLSVVGSAVKGE
jgi:hypothetical protein